MGNISYLLAKLWGGSKPVLDAGGSSRHIKVEDGASLAAHNLVFLNGKVVDDGGASNDGGGSIYAKGYVESLVDCDFRLNAADQGGAVYFAMMEMALVKYQDACLKKTTPSTLVVR